VSTIRYDKELEEFRNLMSVPSKFEDGFSWTSLVGALFIVGVGDAARWVTVILFIEVARRAHKRIRRAELYVLFFMAAAAMGQPFSGLLWNQFYVQSQAAAGMGISEYLPHWFAPNDPEVLAQRNFFDPAWYPAIGMVIFTTLMGRLNGTILTYGLFRLASDIEKLPFPMAPIGAQGIIALADQQIEESGQEVSPEENWRWRVFTIGGVIGLCFGGLYLALPALSTAVLNQPITIFPIPFVEWTQKTEDFLPAFATGLNLNLGHFIVGMVLPFFAVLGGFVGLIITLVANPVLYHVGILSSWEPGMKTPETMFNNNMDFYFSFTIGVSLAVAIAGFWQMFSHMRKTRQLRAKQQELRTEVEPIKPTDRGDIPTPIILGTYVFTSMCYILLSGYLIDWHRSVMFILFFFAFVYTPVISYATARLGRTGGHEVLVAVEGGDRLGADRAGLVDLLRSVHLVAGADPRAGVSLHRGHVGDDRGQSVDHVFLHAGSFQRLRGGLQLEVPLGRREFRRGSFCDHVPAAPADHAHLRGDPRPEPDHAPRGSTPISRRAGRAVLLPQALGA